MDRRCWKDDIDRLVELFKSSGPFRLTDAKKGDARRVTSIVDSSDAVHPLLVDYVQFSVTVDGGEVYTVSGTKSYSPSLGDHYFKIRVESKEDGLLPERFEILDGGCESYSGEMSMPSPRDAALRFTLVDEGAAAINAPIRARLAEAEEQKRALEEAEARARCEEEIRAREARKARQRDEVKALLSGNVVDVVSGFDHDRLATITFVYEDGRRVTTGWATDYPWLPECRDAKLTVSSVKE